MKKFIIGLLFGLIGIPVISDFVDDVDNLTELLSYKIAKRITSEQAEIEKIKQEFLQGEEDEDDCCKSSPMGFQSTSCIGFETSEENDMEEE